MLLAEQPLQLLSFDSLLLRIQPLTFLLGRIAAVESSWILVLKCRIRCAWK